jgi:hypothetical protein
MDAQDWTSWWARPVLVRRRRRSMGLCVLAAVAVGATACVQEGDLADVAVGDVEYEATPEFLDAAAERSQVQPYRMEMRQSLTDGDEVVIETGEWDGERFHARSDLAAQFEPLLPADVDADLTIETAGDDSTLYVRMPVFAALDELTSGFAITPFGDLADRLGTGWGRVDLAGLADVMPGLQDATSQFGTQMPRFFVDVVANAQDVEDLGQDEIRGAAVHGLGAEVPLENLFGAPATPSGGAEMMDDITVPIEVWVDADGLVRRVNFGFHRDDMAEAHGRENDGAPMTVTSLPIDVDYKLDLFDYGDESIEIEFPVGAIDVTDAYRQMFESGRIVVTPPADGG